jgi:fused signal recognition particle receptor
VRIFGLGKKLRELFQRPIRDEAFYEDIEDALVEADLGARIAAELVGNLREAVRQNRATSRQEAMALLRDELGAAVAARSPAVLRGRLNVFMVLGVNGVGKTTTIAKLADYYRRVEGIEDIVLAAGDTFRAAAIEQLEIWGERLKLRVIRQQQGSDPGAVVYDAITSATSRNSELVIVDTAGRLHTKTNLVKELGKLDRVVRGRISDGTYAKLLVIDATTGQNAYRQAEVFHEAVGVDSLVLSKYDSTAKGGILVPLCRDLHIPVAFVGTGEKIEDLSAFDPESYLDELLGAKGEGS